MKKVMFIAVVLAVILCMTPAWSQGGPEGPGGHRGPGMPSAVMAVMPPMPEMISQAAESLALTDDQTTKLTEITTTGQATIQPLVKAAADSAKALRDALSASEYDETTVTKLAAKALADENAAITACISVWTQIREVLTADQVKALQPAPPGGCDPAQKTETE